MSREFVNWLDLKEKPGVWGYSEDSKEYFVYKDDGKRRYFTTLDKEDFQVEGTDTKDFYDNVKPNLD